MLAAILKICLYLIFTLYFVQGSPTSQKINDGRIINGTIATVNATKHQVSFRRRFNDQFFFGTGHICGGSLIAPNVVLTAAHCFVDQVIFDGTFSPHTDFIVVMGTLDRFKQDNETVISDIEKIVFDVPIFNLSTYEKDIALVFLKDSVPTNHTTVQPIEINRREIRANTICQVTGWGTTEEGFLSDVLMTVDVPTIDKGVCANDTDFAPESIREGMMCAGYLDEGERDACNGDSGGPMVCNKLLAGIISWGAGCALPRLPGVYTDVAFYAPWIEMKLKVENITLPDGGGGGGGGAMSNAKSSLLLICCLLLILKFSNA